MKKLMLAFLVLALSVASAKTYNVRLHQPSVVGDTELKAGDYKLDVQDTKIVLKGEKVAVESVVKVETVDSKYPSTSVRYANADGKNRLQEIRLGGTNMKLVLSN
ncbi:MAG: hypothetical protein ACM3ZB_07300 [bacterium]|jgi:hypothetical protein